MDYIRRPEPTVRREPGQTSELTEWVHNDCRLKECIDGNIIREDGLYTKLYNCPRCSRTTVTPGMRIWNGPFTLLTVTEMESRMLERRDLVFNRKERYERATGLIRMLHDICKPVESVTRKRQEIPDLPPGDMPPEELLEAARRSRGKGDENVRKDQR